MHVQICTHDEPGHSWSAFALSKQRSGSCHAQQMKTITLAIILICILIIMLKIIIIEQNHSSSPSYTIIRIRTRTKTTTTTNDQHNNHPPLSWSLHIKVRRTTHQIKFRAKFLRAISMRNGSWELLGGHKSDDGLRHWPFNIWIQPPSHTGINMDESRPKWRFLSKNITNDTIVIDGRKMAVGRGFICPVRSLQVHLCSFLEGSVKFLGHILIQKYIHKHKLNDNSKCHIVFCSTIFRESSFNISAASHPRRESYG